MPKQLETVREAAADTGIPRSRLYELVAKAKANPEDPKRIPFVQIESRIYFRTGSLTGWIERLEALALTEIERPPLAAGEVQSEVQSRKDCAAGSRGLDAKSGDDFNRRGAPDA